MKHLYIPLLTIFATVCTATEPAAEERETVSAWVTRDSLLFSDPEGKKQFAGVIVKRAAISVFDTGTEFVEILVMTAPIRTLEQWAYVKNESISGRLFIRRENLSFSP